MAQQTIRDVSEALFPGIAVSLNKRPDSMVKLGNEVMSDLPLQMSLWLNVCYFPFWLVMTMDSTAIKYQNLNYLYKFILITVLVSIVLIEVCRLYLGYLGNLSERVPELAGFWLLTILLQLPLQAFLLFNEALIILPLERASNSLMVSMVLVQLVLGFTALRRITRHQANKFHLHQLQVQSNLAPF